MAKRWDGGPAGPVAPYAAGFKEELIGVGEIATKRAEVFFRAVLRPMSLPHLSPTWSDDDWVDSQGVRSPG
jgi:hypothetical protein